ncbi:conjugative relaxase domain protein (plasmid) [Gloeothece citriformis PCC 7424]|uniref:Conjugative relaxase domain protein n=1 Tax=Gloeothece citriformis (strain PCC 7424) TaxID=65393 RepID=B7KMV0_GLOC7|nr:MobF family relaxase [Gloeothece citriformis]ACK74122.1 conjugative relaxase domain protein [Gloeothece citriformis PCC 7424]
MVATVGRCYTNPKDYAQENYYSTGDGLTNSEWLGKAASEQGLFGQIQEQHFHNAYQALDPNGDPLRRQQNYRKQVQRHNRPGTDVTLSAPKSISVAALVMGDNLILEAHKAAVRATMNYVEKNCIFYQTKQKGKKLLLQSKTAQIAVFHHDDNRNKDPQLHSHCVILNQTLCPDGKWRAVANEQLYTQIKTIGAYYAHELARQLEQNGCKIQWTDDHIFELAGVDKEKLDAIFSTRSNQIEAELEKLGLTRKTANAQVKQTLCLKTRKEKKHHHQPEDRERQLQRWKQRATEAGIEINREHKTGLEKAYNHPSHPGSIPELLSDASNILTSRQTAFREHELLKECLRQSQGKYDPNLLLAEINQKEELVPTRDGRLTTKSQLNRERKIIELANTGKNSRIPLASREQAQIIAQKRGLNTGQTTALIHIVTSRNAVVLVQGNAGVGKTYTMNALKQTIGNQPIRGLAPSAAAADVLQIESGISSQTLASYLLTKNERLPKKEILLVDEAGMLSSVQMEQLLEKAQANNNRVILVGDTKQLSAVEAGAPFKLLQEHSLPTAIIDQNLRQRDPSLKQVVDKMATHDRDESSINQAYQSLYHQGKVKQIAQEKERVEAISNDYLSRTTEVRNKTLILAGTNADKQIITTAIRQGLMNEGVLGSESKELQTLKRKDLDKFAITKAHHYQRGDVIKFQIDNAQFSRDFYYRVTDVNSITNTVTLIDTNGVDYTLPLDKYKQREVYQVQQLEIRLGEQMRFTKNISNHDYKQLNGQRFTVVGFTLYGQISLLTKGKTMSVSPSQLLHSDYRYVDTVHSSQGQTADYCIYCASAAKSLTIGRESFYVAASRAKQEFIVYTANATDLGVTVQISRANENASDLVKKQVEEGQKSSPSENISTAPSLTHPFAPKTDKDEKASFDNQLSQLSDAELVSVALSVQEWLSSAPREPSLNKEKALRSEIEELQHHQIKLNKQLVTQKQESLQLGEPRSLFNPFGVSKEIIDNQLQKIQLTSSLLHDIEFELKKTKNSFQKWQSEAKAYSLWEENPKTKKVKQLAEQLKSQTIKERIARIKEGYVLYGLAQTILDLKGKKLEDGKYFQGNIYRIQQRETTLTISHKDYDEPLFVATDNRANGGIIEVSQCNLTLLDKENIQSAAKYLEEQKTQSSQKNQSKGFSR